MTELERRFADRVVLVNVPVDLVPIEHEYKHEHNGHDHAEAGHHGDEVDDEALLTPRLPDEARHDVEVFCRTKEIKGTVLLDTGKMAVAYGANDLPTTVMIDKDGYVVRRFSGVRPRAALEAMLGEAMGKGSGVGK